MRVLVLAGTTEAVELVAELVAIGVDVTASFAGRTRVQVALPCPVRVGGFGGVDGLAGALVDDRYDLLVDATHPFAAVMPHHAAAAAKRAGIPRVRLLRPPWEPGAGDDWVDVSDRREAAEALVALGSHRVLLATGRLDLAAFASVGGIHFVTRSIERPDPMPLTDVTVVLDRGPFDVPGELALLSEHRIDTLVTKNSGGSATAAKLEAARTSGCRVVMIGRPPQPVGPKVAIVADAMAWVRWQS